MKVRAIVCVSALILLISSHIQAKDFASFFQTGELVRIRGEYEQAIANYQSARDLAKNSGNISKEAQVLIHLGHISYLQAKYLDAIKSFREAEKLANSVRDKREEVRSWAFSRRL